jgi:predicted amidohydrolase
MKVERFSMFRHKNVSLLLAAACISLCSSLHAVEVIKRREIAVSVIGLPRPQLSIEDVSVDKAADYWIKAMDREIGNNPDLIVLPECCDSPAFKNHIDKAKWIRLRGTKVLDAIRRYAVKHGCYIVYSAHREREDGRFANSCFLVNRKGEVQAVYDKVFPTVGECGSKDCPIVPGKDAVVVDTDFGRIGFVICFDLNFPELMRMYAEKKPDVLVFASFFDGDFQQRVWARECQSYVISSTCSEMLPGRVIDPAGGELRNENYYMPTFTAYINTNCRVLHLDFNRDKFADIIRKYGRRIEIRNPGSVGTVTLLSNDSKLQVDDVVKEFGLETLTDYFTRSRQTRTAALERAKSAK